MIHWELWKSLKFDQADKLESVPENMGYKDTNRSPNHGQEIRLNINQ